MSRTQIQELDQLPLTITLTLNGSPATPNTLRWRLDCLTTGTTDVVSWTSLSASPSVSLTIPATANAIISNVNPVETKRITVQANYSTTLQINKQFEYDVVNNSGYT